MNQPWAPNHIAAPFMDIPFIMRVDLSCKFEETLPWPRLPQPQPQPQPQ